jgi:hypothetical protein
MINQNNILQGQFDNYKKDHESCSQTISDLSQKNAILEEKLRKNFGDFESKLKQLKS